MENNDQNGYINVNAAANTAAPAAAADASVNKTPAVENVAQFAAPAANMYAKPQNAIPYPVAERPAPEKSSSGLGFNIVAMCIGIVSLITSLSCINGIVTTLLSEFSLSSYSSSYSNVTIISQAIVIMITSLVAIVFAVLGLKNKQNPGRGMGVSGIVCSVFALLVSGAALVIASLMYAEVLI